MESVRREPPSLLPAVRGAVAVTVVVAVAVLSFVARFERPVRHGTGDTYFYAREAAEFAGASPAVADQEARRLVCTDVRGRVRLDGTLASPCVSYPVLRNPRYVVIFTSRPGWPLLLAAGVGALGLTRAVIYGSLLGAVLAALAVHLALRGLGSSLAASSAAGVAFSLLPTGVEADTLLPEGTVLAVLVAGVYGAGRLVRGSWWGLAWLVPAAAVLYALKPANGAAFALALVAAGGVLLVPRRTGRLPALVLTGVGAASGAGWLVVSDLLGLPSLTETVQDMATRHFARPDVPDPGLVLKEGNRLLWTTQVERWLGLPRPFALVLPAAVFVVLVLRRAGVVWVAASLAGVAIVVVHPLISQYDRLIVSVWLAVVAAVAVLLDVAARVLRPLVPALSLSEGAARESISTCTARPGGRVSRQGQLWSGRTP
jgi:hypothetical protein